MRRLPAILLSVLALSSCVRHEAAAPASKSWADLVGSRVTIEGNAANAKLGALLQTEQGDIWIDGLDAWPEGYYPGEGKGKRVRVTGVVVERSDLPVFVPNPNEPVMQGIPIEADADIERARKRYLLRDATW